jgi:aconitate hydratase
LAEFTLSRREPDYVKRAKAIKEDGTRFESGNVPMFVHNAMNFAGVKFTGTTELASAIFAKKPGDGSAREQAASCQRVLGAIANIAEEYATKRYRSNLINWGMLPLIFKGDTKFEVDDVIVLPKIREAIATGKTEFLGFLVRKGTCYELRFSMSSLTEDEKSIVLAGSLMNHQRSLRKNEQK